MKKLFTIIIFLAMLCAPVSADIIYENNDPNIKSHMEVPNRMITTQVLVLSANAAAIDLDHKLNGGYLFAVEVFASADDAVTFTINSGLGTELYTTTTSAATSGEIGYPSAYWPITRTANYTLSGLGSGSVTVEVTVVKR